ncbi:invasion associated locus B family protein [Labrys monachus]|uniref:Invasion protein IalB n=1 Tax=Labrys monachus TaxID=217067 RepID=A0ABU0FFQ6_9HYPH|nr:invasion associated locus B family protein [Labrys monachus]MDQ0392943.1 invasion protein IalB [Labrys monachus]
MMSFRLFATAAVAALCLAATPALAQDKPAKPAATTKQKQKPPVKPAAPAKQPESAARAPDAGEEEPQLAGAITPPLSSSQPEWIKVCQNDQQTKKEVCLTNRALRSETGQTLMTAVVVQLTSDKKQILRMILPVGVLIPNGAGIFLDNAHYLSGKFLVCTPEGCLVQIELSDAELAALRKAHTMSVALKTPNQQVVLPLSVDGLAKALDNPPLNPQSVVDEQKKLQEELQKAAEKARSDLNSSAPAPAKPAQ